MLFLIVRWRNLGVAISTDQLRKLQPLSGDIHITDCRDDNFGRSTIRAWVFKSGPGKDEIQDFSM